MHAIYPTSMSGFDDRLPVAHCGTRSGGKFIDPESERMDRPRYDLSGRIVFISGASAGLGAHLGRLYAAAGAAVVLGARRVARSEALAEEISAAIPGYRRLLRSWIERIAVA